MTSQGSEYTAYARSGTPRVLLDREGVERAKYPLHPFVSDVSSDGTWVASVEPAGKGYRVVLRDADDTAPAAQASMRTPLRSVPTPPTSISTTSPSRR